MDAGKDEPAERTGPDGAHVCVEDIVEYLPLVVDLHGWVDGEYAERHHGEGKDPEDSHIDL